MGNLSKESLEFLDGIRITLQEREIAGTLATTKTQCEQFVMQESSKPFEGHTIERFVPFYLQPLDEEGNPIEMPMENMEKVDVGVIIRLLKGEMELRVLGYDEYLAFLGRQAYIKSISPNGYTPGGEILRSANNPIDAGFWGGIAQQLPFQAPAQ